MGCSPMTQSTSQGLPRMSSQTAAYICQMASISSATAGLTQTVGRSPSLLPRRALSLGIGFLSMV